MNSIVILLSTCLLLASFETLHGIIRTKFLVPRVGRKKALKVSAISGSVIAFAICFVMIPKLRIVDTFELTLVGIGLSLFMASFDIFIGKIVMNLRWSRILQDFSPFNGNYLSVALFLLMTYPYAVMRISEMTG